MMRVLFGLSLALLAACAGAAGPTTDIFQAAKIDDVRDVRRLLPGADPKALDDHGDPLLVAAIRGDATKVIDVILADPRTDVEATNAAGETALMIAAWKNRRDVVEKLLARDAEVNRVGWTALHYAAAADAGDVVALLLEHAAYVDAESPNRTTPLMMAARGDHVALCRQLIDAGADPTVVNQRDLNAADFATRADDRALADWLVAQATAWEARYGARAGTRASKRPDLRPESRPAAPVSGG